MFFFLNLLQFSLSMVLIVILFDDKLLKEGYLLA